MLGHASQRGAVPALATAAPDVEFVDLVCVNLYPFERTAGRRGVSEAEVIENIDIGGPTMIRAAAKNHAYAAVVVSPESYDAVLEEMRMSEQDEGTAYDVEAMQAAVTASAG